MRVKSIVGLNDELFVKSFLAYSRLVTRHEEHCLTFGIEGESHSPFSVCRRETQLFHIRVARTVERVHARPAKLWTELLKQAGESKNFFPDLFGQGIELRLKLIANLNSPSHALQYAL